MEIENSIELCVLVYKSVIGEQKVLLDLIRQSPGGGDLAARIFPSSTAVEANRSVFCAAGAGLVCDVDASCKKRPILINAALPLYPW